MTTVSSLRFLVSIKQKLRPHDSWLGREKRAIHLNLVEFGTCSKIADFWLRHNFLNISFSFAP